MAQSFTDGHFLVAAAATAAAAAAAAAADAARVHNRRQARPHLPAARLVVTGFPMNFNYNVINFKKIINRIKLPLSVVLIINLADPPYSYNSQI